MKYLALALLITLSSCGFKEHNQLIADSNNTRLAAYGDAMAKQTSEGGRMAVALMYATGAGMQNFVRPETVLDYANGLLPYANLFMQWYGWGNTKNSPTYHVEGANNSMYVTNESESRNTNTRNDNAYNTHTEDYNTSTSPIE